MQTCARPIWQKRAFIGKEMDSETESEDHVEEEASEESGSSVASLALATTFFSKAIFNSEENGNTNNADEGNDDYAPTYCFMAKGAKVTKYPSPESSEDKPDENPNPTYSNLARIALNHQKPIETQSTHYEIGKASVGERGSALVWIWGASAQ